MEEHNTFDAPEMVKPKDFANISLTQEGLTLEIPPVSVIGITLE